jgi:hypothetical protein
MIEWWILLPAREAAKAIWSKEQNIGKWRSRVVLLDGGMFRRKQSLNPEITLER